MIIEGIVIQADLWDILNKLRQHLSELNFPLLQTMRDTPGNIMVSCPYHKDGQERRPSAGIKKDDGTFHCFACGQTHTLCEVISYCFGYKNDYLGKVGLKWLLKNFVTVGVEDRPKLDLDFSRIHISEKPEYVSEEELDKYRVYHPYMWKRKMTPEVVALFDVGYDSETDCLTFPVRDAFGNCLFVARRSVKTKFFNYPQDVKKPLYGIYELWQNYGLDKVYPPILICESMIDCITSWVYGQPAVALNGLGNDYQFKQLNEIPARAFILATDNDSAGQKAKERIAKNIKTKTKYEFIFPYGKKDINDLTEEEFKNAKLRIYASCKDKRNML